MYRILVEELVPQSGAHDPETDIVTERYRQTVDALNLQSLIAAVNKPARAPRKDKGIRKGEAQS